MSISRHLAKPLPTTEDEEKPPIHVNSPVDEMQQQQTERHTSTTISRPLPLAAITTLNRPDSLRYSRASSQMSDFSWTISEFSEGEGEGEGDSSEQGINSQDWAALAGELKESHIHIGKKPERIISRIHSLTMSEIAEFEQAYHDHAGHQQFSSPFDKETDVEEVNTIEVSDTATTTRFRNADNADSSEIMKVSMDC